MAFHPSLLGLTLPDFSFWFCPEASNVAMCEFGKKANSTDQIV